jgi:hypothetical protein
LASNLKIFSFVVGFGVMVKRVDIEQFFSLAKVVNLIKSDEDTRNFDH